ncbi:GNAT family N-acetyltransferase [Paenibacillus enshidis]|uniref:GNAT family N-acetyltransferase n=1 Tax=Paenibacillus enshidis TaxID=1458439 RepID=A0ABV5AXA3_9BACL
MVYKFETDRLLLRFFELSDASRVQELAGNEEVARTTLSIPHPYPDSAAEQWIGKTRQSAEKGELYAFAMVKKDDGLLIGNTGIRVSQRHKHGELGYWAGKPYWGQGYATEAARRILQFASSGNIYLIGENMRTWCSMEWLKQIILELNK